MAAEYRHERLIIHSDTIRSGLLAIWPELRFIVLSDTKWAPPTLLGVRSFLDEVWKPAMPPYIDGVSECEEFSIGLMALQRRGHADKIMAGEMLPGPNWPLGIVTGTRFRGADIDHWQCICRTEEGIILIEPQTGHFWAPNPGMDQIFFLLM